MILHLHLKEKWYRMIERGEKTEEYREIKPYWIRRLCYTRRHVHCLFRSPDECRYYCFEQKDPFVIDNFTHVCLQLGYKHETMIKEIEAITVGFGRPEWGAPKGRKVFIIKLVKGGES